MFWISVSMLGSDYEYEFLLAVRLLDKVFDDDNVAALGSHAVLEDDSIGI
jgi:hypothetical protein